MAAAHADSFFYFLHISCTLTRTSSSNRNNLALPPRVVKCRLQPGLCLRRIIANFYGAQEGDATEGNEAGHGDATEGKEAGQ